MVQGGKAGGIRHGSVRTALALGLTSFMLACAPSPGHPGASAAAVAGLDAYPQRGPYQVRMYEDPGLPGHTVYLPAVATGARMPIVAWANGSCGAVGNRYARFLSDLASHGMLVIAIGRIGDPRFETDPAARTVVLPPGSPRPGDQAPSDYTQLTTAINWAIAQDSTRSSELYSKVSTHKIAVMGHSCGGLQALSIAAQDRRVTTTVMMNSGVWSEDLIAPPGQIATKASLATLNGSIAYFSGDPSDGAYFNSQDDFGRLANIPAVWAYRRDIGHGGRFWTAGDDEYARIAGAWLRWQLMGEPDAARLFTGTDCILCTTPGWTVNRKGIE